MDTRCSILRINIVHTAGAERLKLSLCLDLCNQCSKLRFYFVHLDLFMCYSLYEPI